jgi:murein DD-endopeptidase MepM/ murein hydrolase activator NlpD
MPPEEGRRKKNHAGYEILLVPQREGGKKRSFHASKVGLWALGVLTCFVISTVVLMLLVYTPIAMYIPIKNPELEQRYGRQILETQQRLNALAQDVLILRDYNQQLRKVLGESSGKDSSATKSFATRTPQQFVEPVQVEDSGYVGSQEEIPGSAESYDDYDLAAGPYRTVLTTHGGVRGGFPLLAPTGGIVTQGFDPSHRHFGIDYAVKRGTAVYAATDGYVVFSGWTYDDGNMIILSHGGGYLTLYKHNQQLFKSSHTFAKRGELIAESGSTGQTSSGPHLHFEVWKDGLPQNPYEYLLTTPNIQ